MKRVRFVYESNFDYLNVWFDSDKMGSILKNILSNALKYTPENGSVCICACEEGDTWSIEVKDTNQFIYQHQSNPTSGHFQIDYITTPETISE